MIKSKIAIFDFDGTLTRQDTFRALLKAGYLRQPWRTLLLLPFFPVFLFTILGRLDKCYAKSILLWGITVGKGRIQSIRFLKDLASNLCLPPGPWFAEAHEVLKTFDLSDTEIVIVTASGGAWVRPLLRSLRPQGVRLLICSRLGFFAGGVIMTSRNCYHMEKIHRLQEHAWIKNCEIVSTWSDHIADIPLLNLSSEKHIVCPHPSHRKVFTTLWKESGCHFENWKK